MRARESKSEGVEERQVVALLDCGLASVLHCLTGCYIWSHFIMCGLVHFPDDRGSKHF